MRNKGVLSSLAVLLGTVSILSALLVLDPFDWTRALLIVAFQAGADSAKINKLYQNPNTQEITNGQNPSESLKTLEQAWRDCGDRDRVVLTGNSQTYAVILAPGEQPQASPEKTYPDLVFAHYSDGGQNLCAYRMSAPNISYMEVLWYLHSLLMRPGSRPTRIVLQLNYETFRKSDIRDGLLPMLTQSEFAASIKEEAVREADYSDTFGQALRRYRELTVKRGQTGDAPAEGNGPVPDAGRTGISESSGIGPRLEASVRRELDRLPAWEKRHSLKSNFLDVLYLLRVHVLRIGPTTRRAIGGAALSASLSSLEAVAELCRTNHIELILFNAPQNPSAPLYLSAKYRDDYELMIRDLANRHGLRFYDFENTLPNEYWGVWIDGPDPIHFGREGHKRMAQLMIESGIFAPSR